MSKTDTKIKILQKGSEIIHRRGFNNTGIKEILTSADVPKGSFYFYFKSKEDFGLELIDYFGRKLIDIVDEFLLNKDMSPIDRMRSLFSAFAEFNKEDDYGSGCPIGNLSQEMGNLNNAFREKLNNIFIKMENRFLDCLNEAQKEGQISSSLDAEIVSNFIVNSWEGSILRMKVAKDDKPHKSFMNLIFEEILTN